MYTDGGMTKQNKQNSRAPTRAQEAGGAGASAAGTSAYAFFLVFSFTRRPLPLLPHGACGHNIRPTPTTFFFFFFFS
jgi:hypothetical protein